MIDLNTNEEFSDPEAERMRLAIAWDHCESPNGYFQGRGECTPEKPTCRIHRAKAAVERLLDEMAQKSARLETMSEYAATTAGELARYRAIVDAARAAAAAETDMPERAI